LVKSGEKRFFPSELSKHFVKHLIDKILAKELKGNPRLEKIEREKELESQILGKEMPTKSDEKKTFKQEAEEHEILVKAMLAEKERKEKEIKIEALKLTEDNV